MRSCDLEKARLIEQKVSLGPWSPSPHPWHYHLTAFTLGLCENRGGGRSGRTFHHREFMSAGTKGNTMPKYCVTQANSLRNHRKRQFRESLTRTSSLS